MWNVQFHVTRNGIHVTSRDLMVLVQNNLGAHTMKSPVSWDGLNTSPDSANTSISLVCGKDLEREAGLPGKVTLHSLDLLGKQGRPTPHYDVPMKGYSVFKIVFWVNNAPPWRFSGENLHSLKLWRLRGKCEPWDSY